MPGNFPEPSDAVRDLPSWAAEVVRVWDEFRQEYLGSNREIGGRLVTRGGRQRKVTVVESASYVIRRDDEIIDVNFAGAVSLTLPDNPYRGGEQVVQDSSGAASSNTISLSPPGGVNLNGGSGAQTITTDYGRLVVNYNGTQFIAA